MSAIEAFPETPERRRGTRIRPANAIRIAVGRGNGMIVDVSETGMRIRHTMPTQRGAIARLRFEWEGDHFDCAAEVLSSRVVSLGDAMSPATIYESRFHFVRLSDVSREVLRRVLDAISNRELQQWVDNLLGCCDRDESNTAARFATGAYVRCSLFGNDWQTRWTQDPKQPRNGFLLPSTVTPQDVASLCETYARSNADGRHLIRLMAEEVVGGSDRR